MTITKSQLLQLIDGVFAGIETASAKVPVWGSYLVSAEKVANGVADSNVDTIIAELARVGITVID